MLPGWLLRMQLAVLWGTWRGQHIPPGGTVVPEGDRNGSLLQELGILMGNLVVLLLYLYRVNSAGPCFMVSYTNLCKSLNCQNTNIVGKNPCEIVESLPQQHSLSCSLWLLPILVSTVSLQCLNSLPHSYIICCASNSLYCGCLWIINTPAGRLAGQTEGRERSSVQVGLSSNYPLQTHPSETGLYQIHFKLASKFCEFKSYEKGSWRRQMAGQTVCAYVPLPSNFVWKL